MTSPDRPPLPTAERLGLAACHACGLVSRHGVPGKAVCPRCGGALHRRKPNSIQRTWALLLAAVILYLPANLLPILETRSAFGVSQDTILSGVVYLWVSGSWPLALVVFVASVLVPLLKLLSLAYLNLSVQRHSVRRPLERARLYRLVEVVGRWSMLDVFVVAMLAALVNLEPMAVMRAGPAAAYFSAVVVLTMFAAMSFEPRLIWDPVSKPHAEH